MRLKRRKKRLLLPKRDEIKSIKFKGKKKKKNSKIYAYNTLVKQNIINFGLLDSGKC